MALCFFLRSTYILRAKTLSDLGAVLAVHGVLTVSVQQLLPRDVPCPHVWSSCCWPWDWLRHVVQPMPYCPDCNICASRCVVLLVMTGLCVQLPVLKAGEELHFSTGHCAKLAYSSATWSLGQVLDSSAGSQSR